jgi:hypothetical protein
MAKACSRDDCRDSGGQPGIRVFMACLGLLLTSAPAAKAHRVEGYLQATLIDLIPDRVELELNITPGLEKFSELLASVDQNHDGEVSTQEWNLYAAQVVEDLSLEFDHRRQPLILTGSSFPPLKDIRAGVGTITLKLAAELPGLHQGRHHLYFRNRHRTSAGDYLVNCLQPTNGIKITQQVRDTRQTEIDLDFFVPNTFQSSAVTLNRLPRWLMAPGFLLFLNLVRAWRLRSPLRLGR